MKKKTVNLYTLPAWMGISILTITAFFLFVPTLHFGFVFDDYPTLLEYHPLRLSSLGNILFSSSRWLSRLLQKIGFMIGGMEPVGFRLINLLLHIAAGLLVYVLFISLLEQSKEEWFRVRARLLAFIAAFLFLVHPAQTQTATYITQMGTEGLAGFIVVLVTFFFVQGAKAVEKVRKISWYGLAIASAYVGCGSKEIIVVLPALVFLTDFLLIAHLEIKKIMPRLVMHALLGLTMLFALGRIGTNVPLLVRAAPKEELPCNRGTSITETSRDVIKPNLYRWTQPKVLFHYLSIFFWPAGLCFEYGMRLVQQPLSLDVMLPLFFFVLLISLSLALLIKRRFVPLLFGLGWFAVVMLPRAIVPSQELVCDYKTYIASVGIMLLLAIIGLYSVERLSGLIKTQLRSYVVPSSLIMAGSLLFVGSHLRNKVWKDEFSFWGDVVAKVPWGARGHNNLGIAYLVKNEIEEAISHFKKAVQLDTTYGEPAANLAYLYDRLGDRLSATHYYELALASGEQHPQLFYNLALFNKRGNEYTLAERALRHALHIRPFFPAARFELISLLMEGNRYKEVAQICEETFALNAAIDHPFTLFYGKALFELGDIKNALTALHASGDASPDVAFMKGCCLFEMKDYAEAVKYFEVAYQHNKHAIGVAYNFGQALLRIGEYERALEALGRCNRVVAQLPALPLLKARCLHGLGQRNESKRMLTQLIHETDNLAVRKDAQDFLKTI